MDLWRQPITNTFMTFWRTSCRCRLNRGVVALLLLLLMAFVIWFGKDLMVKVMSYLVWPFIASSGGDLPVPDPLLE